MRRITPVLLLTLLVMASCQTTGGQDVSPAEYVHTARQVYTVAVQTMTTLGRANLIDLDDAEKFEAVRVKAAALLEAADAAVEGGAQFSFADLNAVIQSLKDIVVIISQGVGS